ncbi:MAG: TerB family tellurite resistance protein [archaeon]|nr:TerB family tellurite resistance protein [archaeon]
MSAIDFETLCNNAVKMGYGAIAEAFHSRSEEVMLALDTLNDSEIDGMETYIRFLLASVAADGTLALEEYFLLRRMFDHILGKTTEYDDAVWFMMDNGLTDRSKYHGLIESMRNVLSRLDEPMRQKLVEISVLISAADGVITDDEKAWIRQIAFPSEGAASDGLIDNIMSTEGHSDLRNRF